MWKKSTELRVMRGFDYSRLENDAAKCALSAAARIREKVKRSLEDIIEVGAELLTIKRLLPHGEFLPWLKAEFGWTERTARNLMAVAERFSKTEMISDLRIQPTAAYLLAAPSTPDEARLTAVERAEAGEQITMAVAKEIVAASRKRLRPRVQPAPAGKLADRLLKTLKLYRLKWDSSRISEMARYLHEFAADLEKTRSKLQEKKQA